MKILRDYQNWAIDGKEPYPGINRALKDHPSALLVMATGLGKTVIISRVANEWTNGNILMLAHRIELVDQMADTLAVEMGYRPTVEQGPRGIDPETLYAGGNTIVGSIQSMITKRRRDKFRHHPFGLMIIDECHRATSPSYVKLIDLYRELDPNMRVLGVTATPNRTDGTALGLVFASVAYNMGINEGIDHGYLVDIHQKFAVVEHLDLSKVKCVRNDLGEIDFKRDELEAVLKQEGVLHAMSRPVLDLTKDGAQAIIFAASVPHAHLWSAVLNHYRPGCAAAIDGTMLKGEGQPRTERVKGYKEGKLQFLINYNIATEGFDAPNTKFVIMGRPTKSVLVYTQMLGRCTRPLPGVVDPHPTPEERQDAIAASAKPFATVLDFVGNTRHQVITATDVLGGNFDVDVRAAADEIIGAERTRGNVRDAINKARANMLLEAEERRRRPARDAIQNTDLKYSITNVNGFSGKNGVHKPATSRGGSTDSQVAALVNLGVKRETAEGMGRKQAGAVMTAMMAKRCTEKQAQTLRKFGFDPEKFNFKAASEQITEIANNGWRWP